MFSSAPTIGLCNSGSSSSVTVSGRNYLWTCNGSSGSCGGSSGSDVNCTALRNRAPTFVSLIVNNSADVNVPSDNLAGGRLGNHICQAQLASDRIVKFVVTADDPDGVSDIQTVQLRINGIVYDPVGYAAGVATFVVSYPASDPNGLYKVETNITDILVV